ncbi:Mu-like prophage major head subunit gpT family protein [uncultured Sulfitobacter sp.]|uniref:Mu-like prophage major head subunit gpT family protein n=1 Tax=uncultured Sulfitobacter sp. TaxID=191468 RepID=UPI002597115C|nr:Mu-like prophage major head subunit gpT family protein [uncultured Sulfitobacter sp.]
MLINENNLDLVFKAFNSVYSDAYLEADTHWDKIAMTIPSSAAEEQYGWIGQFPHLREWIGPRVVHAFKAHGFTIQNKRFESTLAVPRTAIADDRFGVFKPAFSEMGRVAKTHPEELVMGLLKSGFETACFDGQNFFDADHPVTDKNGDVATVSNMQAGSGPAWYLLDTSRGVRPIIFQEREAYKFTAMTRDGDYNVFMHDEYMYGVQARVNAGFGLWQLAFGSKADLTAANYAAARASMMDFRADGGRILGVSPKMLVVPPSLEEAALHLINTDTNDGGGSNPWRGTVEVVVSPYIAD